MTPTQKVAATVFGLIMLCACSVAALYGAAGAFLLANKRNPLTVSGPSAYFTYWSAYSDDRELRNKLLASGAISAGVFYLALPVALIALTRRKRELHGSARFAHRSEIRNAGLFGGKGIIVGRMGNRFLMLAGELFALLAAPTRSGKGVGIVIPNLLNWPDSVMVTDVKEENFLITSGYRAQHGQAVYAFRPYNEEGSTHRYNPLSVVRDSPLHRVGDVQSIAAVLYALPSREDGEGSAKFFAERARDLFLGLALYVKETPELPFTLGELLRQSSGKGKSFREYMQTNIATRRASGRPLSDACVDALERCISNPDNTLGNIVSTFTAPLSIFADPLVDAATSCSDFSLADVRKRRMSIYLIIPIKKLPVCGLLLNLMFTQLIEQNTDQLPKQNPALKYSCLMLMDEFAAMGRLTVLEKGVAYLAGYGLRFLTIVQSKAQLESIYGRAEARAFVTNHALQLVYAPKDQEDAQDYSALLGTFTEKAESRGRSRSFGPRNGSSSSSNISDQRRALMLPQELRQLGPDKEIVVLENTPPILCDKIRYYKEKVFTSRLLPPIQVPAHKLHIHMARVQGRVRGAVPSDFEGGIDLEALAHDLHSLPDLTEGASKEEIAGFVDEFFDSLGVKERSAGARKNQIVLSEDAINSIDLAELER